MEGIETFGGVWIKSEIEKNSNLTKEELLFLHLFRYNNQKENHVVSSQLTQHGIQNCIECDGSFVSRLLKKNEENGYIYHHLSIIEYKKRKQFVYFLTGQGINLAKELKRRYPNLELNENKKSIIQRHLLDFFI